MKNLILIILVISFTQINAQQQDYSSECKKQMKQLAMFAGKWKGTATVRRGPGEPITIEQHENIEWRLDSVLLLSEGKGYQNNELAFNAFAVINYDPINKKFGLKSYTKEGLEVEANFAKTGDRDFEWDFTVPSGKVKYHISFSEDQKTWTEKGTYSADGSTWQPFINMELKKIE